MAEAWRTGVPAVPLEESAISTLATLEAQISLDQRASRNIEPSQIGLE